MSFKQKIKQSKRVERFKKWADKVVLPGFHGMSLRVAGGFLVEEFKSVHLNERTAAVTYNFLMAIPPSLLFFCSLIPYLPLGNITPTLLSIVRVVTPNANAYDSASSFVLDLVNKEQRGLLSFGVLLTLFFSTNGMAGLMRSFDRNNGVYIFRTGLRRRWMAIKLTIMLIIVVIIALGVLLLQSAFINDYLDAIFGTVWAIKTFSILLLIGIVFLAISTIYRYGPSLTQKFHFVSAGSVLATFLCIATSATFFYLVNNFLQYNKLYGSIGTLIAFMVWLYLNVLVILLGYELNIGLLIGKLETQGDGKKVDKED